MNCARFHVPSGLQSESYNWTRPRPDRLRHFWVPWASLGPGLRRLDIPKKVPKLGLCLGPKRGTRYPNSPITLLQESCKKRFMYLTLFANVVHLIDHVLQPKGLKLTRTSCLRPSFSTDRGVEDSNVVRFKYGGEFRARISEESSLVTASCV